MNKSRVENLSDGVFAIVMTILVIDLKVPNLAENGHLATDLQIVESIKDSIPLVLAYFATFAVLATYWISHHYLISSFSKNINRILINLNILFLSLIALVPFSSHFLGIYNNSKVAIFIFALNMILVSLSLMFIRNYIYRSDEIENEEYSQRDRRRSKIHIILPLFFAVLAILASFLNTNISMILFVFPIIINSIPGSLNFLEKIMKGFFKNFSL